MRTGKNGGGLSKTTQNIRDMSEKNNIGETENRVEEGESKGRAVLASYHDLRTSVKEWLQGSGEFTVIHIGR